jgi:hypothetical protein
MNARFPRKYFSATDFLGSAPAYTWRNSVENRGGRWLFLSHLALALSFFAAYIAVN